LAVFIKQMKVLLSVAAVTFAGRVMTKTRREQVDPNWDWNDDQEPRANRVDIRPELRKPVEPPVPPPAVAAARRRPPAKAGGSRNGMLIPTIAAAVILLAVAAGAAWYFLSGGTTSGNVAGQPRAITLQPNEVIVFSGASSDMKTAPGNTVAQQSTGENGTVVIRSTASNPSAGGTTGGAYVTLPADRLKDLAGRRVRVTAWARAAEQKPSSRFALAVAGQNFGTGWLVFTPTGTFQPYLLDFVVPKNVADGANIGIWSDIDGRDGGLELRLLTVRPVS